MADPSELRTIEDGARRSELGFAPRIVYPAKRVYSHARTLGWRLRGAKRDHSGGLRILLYHRVTGEPDRLAVSPGRFSDQVGHIRSLGIRLVDVESAAERLAAGLDCSEICALTFDDGYADVLTNAVPVLRRYGFSATMFIPTGAIDGTSEFPWYEGRQPPLMNWEEIRLLAADGTLRFGAHTVTHPNLLALSEDSARDEIDRSKRDLERQLGAPVESFSYPAGLYSPRDVALVSDAGFRVAVTCDPGVNDSGSDLLALRRTQIDGIDGPMGFGAKLGGAHDRPFPMQRAFRRARYG